MKRHRGGTLRVLLWGQPIRCCAWVLFNGERFLMVAGWHRSLELVSPGQFRTWPSVLRAEVRAAGLPEMEVQ